MNRRLKSAVKRLITLLRLLPVNTNNFLNLPPFSLFNIFPFHYYSRIFKWLLSLSLIVNGWYSSNSEYCADIQDLLYYAKKILIFDSRTTCSCLVVVKHQFLLSLAVGKFPLTISINQCMRYWKSILILSQLKVSETYDSSQN